MMLLVLFSAILLHSFLPHVHHAHSQSEVVADEHHHHNHDHQHSHSEDYSEKDNSLELLDFLLGHHSHSELNSDVATEYSRSIQSNIELQKQVYASTSVVFSGFSLVTEKLPFPPERRQSIRKSFLLSCSLRAPPVLG